MREEGGKKGNAGDWRRKGEMQGRPVPGGPVSRGRPGQTQKDFTRPVVLYLQREGRKGVGGSPGLKG